MVVVRVKVIHVSLDQRSELVLSTCYLNFENQIITSMVFAKARGTWCIHALRPIFRLCQMVVDVEVMKPSFRSG